MTDTLKMILAGVLGIGTGGAIVGLYVKNKYEKILETEIASVRDYYQAREDDRDAIDEELERIQELREMPDPTPEQVEAVRLAAVEVEKVAYNTVEPSEPEIKTAPSSNGYSQLIDELEKSEETADLEDDPLFVEGRRLTEERKAAIRGVHPISDQQFSEEMRHHDKLSLTYYKGDDTLVDGDENVVPDALATVGQLTLMTLRDETNLETLYVRHAASGVDFEISQVDSTFTLEVLGIDPDDQG